MKSAEGGMSSARQGCMESSRRDVCYQADEGGLDKKLSNPIGLLNFLEAPPGIGPGMKVLQTSALPLGYGAEYGADYGARTRHLHLGKVALYQMS